MRGSRRSVKRAFDRIPPHADLCGPAPAGSWIDMRFGQTIGFSQTAIFVQDAQRHKLKGALQALSGGCILYAASISASC